MKKKQPNRGRPQQPLGPGPVHHVLINLSRPEAATLRAAAKRAHMPVATYVRMIVVPIALNSMADKANKSTVLDRIQQQTKVAENTFDVS